MLKDSLQINQPPLPYDLDVSVNLEVTQIIAFLDINIPGFPQYFDEIKDSNRENRISDLLVHHLQLCKTEQSDGYFPFDFRKNPTQAISGKETDIGVFVLTRGIKPLPILELEAKRFSATSNNEQYVFGAGRGGIERFKRGEHSSHLTICGMLAYVQKPTSDDWIKKVNGWIYNLANTNTDTTIDWTGKEEQLIKVNTYTKVEKLSSKHIRKQSGDTIFLWHYFIDLN
jgi:hypothetical protein